MDALPVDDNPPPHVHRESWFWLAVVVVPLVVTIGVALMVAPR